MKRFIPLKFLFLFLFSIFFANSKSLVWGHSGHKHDELNIKLPKVVARVNDQDIKGDVIFRELKKASVQYKKRGMPLTTEQEKSAAKTLIDDEIGRTLLVLKAKAMGVKVSEKMLQKRLKEVKAKLKSDSIFVLYSLLLEFSTFITLQLLSIDFKQLLILFSLLKEVITTVISFIDII